MFFKSLQISHWQQFKYINLIFDKRATIITGANGSGKTTILNILAQHVGWKFSCLSVPRFTSGKFKYFNDQNNKDYPYSGNKIGKLRYSDNSDCTISIPKVNNATYNLHFDKIKPVKCCFIPSTRSTYRYNPIGSIPTQKTESRQAYQEASEVYRQIHSGAQGGSVSSSLKKNMIGWAIKGFGISDSEKIVMPKDPEQEMLFKGFIQVLRTIMPPKIRFNDLEIRNMELVLICNDGKDEFILETVSGGVSSLIDIAWQIYMFVQEEQFEYTVMIDEIENHLHPEMQRSILPNLMDAFPEVKFIISTHSPFIIGSVRDSSVYAFQYDDNNKVESKKIDLANDPKTATELLNDVLGISFTLPIWVENDIENIINSNIEGDISGENLKTILFELKKAGLEKFTLFTIENLVGKSDKN